MMTLRAIRMLLLLAFAVLTLPLADTAEAEVKQGQTIRHVTIRGHVQHVHYRAWTQHTALQTGVQGWVRNRRDGSVEAVFAGSRAAVNALLAACRKGPPLAQVTGIDQRAGTVVMLDLRQSGDRFSILPTW